jgi:RNA polymerase sigma-70 factor (ECF subfamily)
MDHGPHFAALQPTLLMSAPDDAKRAAELAETAALIEQTLGGNSGSFEKLICRYERRVLSLATKLLASPSDAQDAAQEVFLRVFKYLHRFDRTRPIEPWLMQTTVNVCRNIGRSRQRRWETFPAFTGDENSAVCRKPDPHEGLTQEQGRQLLWKALDSLAEKERLAVILRDIDGLTTAEVAEVLGSSETTVRSQISRARVRLKAVLDQILEGRR